jgi:poly(3-hydroxybutyrate) depolymerase
MAGSDARGDAPPVATTPAPTPGTADAARLHADALAALARARARLPSLPATARDISFPSVEMLIEDADTRAASITVPARDTAFVRDQLATARAYADELAAGRDPYHAAAGVMVKAYRSDVDGTLQPYALYVPRGQAPAGGWPLVVSLHGAYSNHRLNLRRAFGQSNHPGETDEEASRNLPLLSLPDVPMLVVSPFGRGEFMGYEGLGERDVMQVIADVRAAYPVDPDRIHLTGLSMGGEGTWHIGLRHPDLFASLAPVCGITDARHWITPADGALHDTALLALTTPLAVAENAANLNVIFFHGDRDASVPVAQARAMAERYRQLGWLGKNVRYHELPGVEHPAWEVAYRDATLLRTLAAFKRDPFPRHVVYKTPSLRYNQAYWLRIDAFEHGLALGEIEGDRTGERAFAVRVKNVSAFSLLLDARHLPGDQPITVTVGGAAAYQGPPRPVLGLARGGDGVWRAVAAPPAPGSTPAPAPDHGSSGLFSRALARERPHLYVYGTAGPPALTAANRALARALGDWGHGVRARFDVKSDREVSAADVARFDVVLVGGPRSNAVVARLQAALPVDDRADRLVAGALVLRDTDRAYRLAGPSPLAPGRQLLIYAADTPRGLARFQRFAKGNADAWGPESNLDYLVYDGAGTIRLGGVFRDRWKIGE